MNLLDQYRGLRREIYILAFGRMVTNLGSMIWPVMTMILSQKIGLSASEISYVFVVATILMLPANIVGGKLADRFNKKHIIVFCDSISIILYVISAFIPLGLGTVILFLFAGIFQSVEYPAYDTLIADLSTTKDRERAYSLEYLGANLGLVLSPTIAGLLFKNYLWLSFLISGTAIAVSTVLIAIRIRDITPVADTSEEAEYQKKKDGVSVFRILREKPVLILYLLCGTLFASAYHQYNFIMPLDMAAVHGDSGAVIFGTVSSLNCITVVIFTPIITKLFVKIRDTGKMLTGRVLVFAGYMVFIGLLGFIPGYYLAMFIFTWGEIFDVLSSGPYISTRVPASHRGRITGLISVAAAAVAGVIDVTVGQVYDRAGSNWTWTLILAVTLASIVIAAVLMRCDRKAYPKLYLAVKREDAEQTPDARE